MIEERTRFARVSLTESSVSSDDQSQQEGVDFKSKQEPPPSTNSGGGSGLWSFLYKGLHIVDNLVNIAVPESLDKQLASEMLGFGSQTEDKVPVVVAVESTAISFADFAHHSHAGAEYDRSPMPGSFRTNFVGIVEKCGSDADKYNIFPGIRVASVRKTQSLNTQVSTFCDNLLVVPRYLDASDVACLVSNYLPAFQALHHGRSRPYRFSRRCLRGRNILVTGGEHLEARAIVRLALIAGASVVCVSAAKSFHDTIEKQHGVALSDNPRDWIEDVEGDMDVIVDFGFPTDFEIIRRALARKGRLVCVPQPRASDFSKLMADIDCLYERYQISLMKRATIFDFQLSAQTNHDGLVEDLNYLLRLLSTRQIRPEIDRFIRMDGLNSLLDGLESIAPTGAVVCEHDYRL